MSTTKAERPPHAESTPAAAPSAFAATLARLRGNLGRSLLFLTALCSGIALLLSTVFSGSLAVQAVYSFSIGGACLLAASVGRLAVAAVQDRWHRGRSGVAPGDGPQPGWAAAIAGTVLALPIGPSAGLWLADRLTGHRSVSLLQWDSPGTRVTLLLSVLGSMVAVAVLGALERLAVARAQAEAAQRLAAENRLRLLQSQLEPHMLFNTLANLRVLIALDPPRAQAMLDRLIAFLRATLMASRATTQPLAAEFARLADYLALIGVRMGRRLQVEIDLPDALRAVPVPTLLLQPLVENAIKHGLEPKVEGGRVEVRARVQRPGVLELTVRDDGAGLPAATAMPATATAAGDGGSRFGVAQTRARLQTLHSGRATLTLTDAPGGGTLATIAMPLPAGSSAAGDRR